MSSLQLQRIGTREDPEWETFLDHAPGATLFHRLSFLAYHAPGRFRCHHLVARRDGRIVGVIPLAETTVGGTRDLRSPYGGSFGGWVVSPELDAADRRALDALLLDYAAAHGFETVTCTTSPAPYAETDGPGRERADRQARRDGTLLRRELTHIVPLHVGAIRGSARRSARRAERSGIRVRAARAGDLETFHAMVARDKARLGSTPTHTLGELREIRRRHPDAVSLRLAEGEEGDIAGGVLIFRCSPRIDLVFYAARARGDAPAEHGCMNLLYEHVILEARTRHAVWLDLGTSSIGGVVNPGLSFFKESMGGVAFERVTRRFPVVGVPALSEAGSHRDAGDAAGAGLRTATGPASVPAAPPA